MPDLDMKPPPPLCYRCARHAGKRLHWCIRLAFPPGQPPVRCTCPCRGR